MDSAEGVLCSSWSCLCPSLWHTSPLAHSWCREKAPTQMQLQCQILRRRPLWRGPEASETLDHLLTSQYRENVAHLSLCWRGRHIEGNETCFDSVGTTPNLNFEVSQSPPNFNTVCSAKRGRAAFLWTHICHEQGPQSFLKKTQNNIRNCKVNRIDTSLYVAK